MGSFPVLSFCNSVTQPSYLNWIVATATALSFFKPSNSLNWYHYFGIIFFIPGTSQAARNLSANTTLIPSGEDIFN